MIDLEPLAQQRREPRVHRLVGVGFVIEQDMGCEGREPGGDLPYVQVLDVGYPLMPIMSVRTRSGSIPRGAASRSTRVDSRMSP